MHDQKAYVTLFLFIKKRIKVRKVKSTRTEREAARIIDMH